MSDHSIFSPSAAHRWVNCPGSVALEQTLPKDEGSKYADEGTDAHTLAAKTLAKPIGEAKDFLGEAMPNGYIADFEMCHQVQKYIDYVKEQASYGGELYIEERLDFSEAIGQPDAFGTADAVIVNSEEGLITVMDLKYGMGRVDAGGNEQLLLYALGALEAFSFFAEFTRFKMVIIQPRLDNVDEWECDLVWLNRFAEEAKKAADSVGVSPVKSFNLNPGKKQCQWCRAKAICPALNGEVMSRLVDAPANEVHRVPAFIKKEHIRNNIDHTHVLDTDKLANCMSFVPLIEMWCEAIMKEGKARRLNGQDVPGFKVVRGKKGNRKWVDEKEAEAAMKSMRLRIEDMYAMKLISPTQAEAVLEDSPRRWKKLEPLIGRADGGLTIAPESDKRPAVALQNAIDDFEVLEDDE